MDSGPGNIQHRRRSETGGLDACPWTDCDWVSAALQLGARSVPGWSGEEESLPSGVRALPSEMVAMLGERILANEDPLGEIFSALRTPEVRRDFGATYTPSGIV